MKLIIKIFLFHLLLLPGMLPSAKASPTKDSLRVFEADNPLFQYVGRIDFRDVKKPRFWSPGVYIKAKFKGAYCELLINDQELWGKNHNYLEIVIDGKPTRIQTKEKVNNIVIAEGLANLEHTLKLPTVVK